MLLNLSKKLRVTRVLFNAPHRSIYLKDRDLHSPQEAEERLLLQYIRNYMNVDPRELSEADKAKYLVQAKELQAKFVQQAKSESSRLD